ncbi:MAG: GNAT family N-acetyltransferase [Clostridia bacterium]|nr:GNAT family N-acetyltransferase [Clostridia bacterium]
MDRSYEARRFCDSDAVEVSDLIARTLRTVSIRDYSSEYVENIVKMFEPQKIIDRASWTHFYVICDQGKIVGCCAIGPYYDKKDESSFFNVFVLPEYQGKGVGGKIIQTLESDEFFLRAKRVEVPSSITAVEFYKKFGYKYKEGGDVLDQDLLFHLEKFR